MDERVSFRKIKQTGIMPNVSLYNWIYELAWLFSALQVVDARWNVSWQQGGLNRNRKTGQNTFLFYNIWQKDFSANIYKFNYFSLKNIPEENKFYFCGFLKRNLYQSWLMINIGVVRSIGSNLEIIILRPRLITSNIFLPQSFITKDTNCIML